MKVRTVLLVLAMGATSVSAAMAQTSDPKLREQCGEDVKKLCADVQPGEGRILKCLRDNKDKLSQPCKDGLAARRRIERPNAPPN